MTGRRGWCPSLHEPMRSGDGLLVRLKPPLGRLSAAAARDVAALARRHGNGVVELTARGGLQLRGLSPAGLGPFAAAMVSAGLALADPGAERVRNVLCSPLAGVDPAAAPATPAVAAALEAALAGTAVLRALPGKALVAVDGGGALPLGPTGPGTTGSETMGAEMGADILVRLDGAGAALSLAGSGLVARSGADGAVAAVLALAGAWVALSGEGPVPRLRHLPAAAVFARAGIACGPVVPEGGDGAAARPGRVVGAATPASGPSAPPAPMTRDRAMPGHGIGVVSCGASLAVGLGLPFGQTDADGLLRLAALAEAYGDGVLRLSPWRAVLLAGVAPGRVAALQAAAGEGGLIVAPGDARLGFAACPGSAGCLSGTVPARADAALLARSLGRLAAGMVHVSGCAKGCAHPAAATATLVGANGRYDLVRFGRATDGAVATGLTLSEVAALLDLSFSQGFFFPPGISSSSGLSR